mmetsp:Transcript_52299/g.138665  ORF Transcript_52299/g.138665 Transcript_52299/m.138665 type:complete len:105 (+) Transcript_52299:580-894(+)
MMWRVWMRGARFCIVGLLVAARQCIVDPVQRGMGWTLAVRGGEDPGREDAAVGAFWNSGVDRSVTSVGGWLLREQLRRTGGEMRVQSTAGAGFVWLDRRFSWIV